MTEYYGPTAESTDDDDDSESLPAPSERAPVKQVGEILLGAHEKKDIANAKPEKHETFWARSEEKPETIEIPAAIIDLSHEIDDDDDDEEEEDGASSSERSAEDAGETAAPLEELAEEEKKVAVEAFNEEEREQLEAEREAVDPNTAEDYAIAAAERFIDKVDEIQEENPDKPVEEVIEEAETETRQLIEQEAEVTPAEASEEADTPEEPEVEAEPVASPEATPEADEEEDPAVAAAAAAAAGGGAATPPPTSGSGGTGTPPPGSPGGPPGTPLSPIGGGPASFGVPGGSAARSFNTLSTAPGITPEDLDAAKRRGETTGLVVGGILGYLLGRRRGRIKTEKRLLPIQEKLEGQVKGLHETVSEKEQAIRRLAAEKFNALEAANRETVIEKTRPQPKPPKQLPFDRRSEALVTRESARVETERLPLGAAAETNPIRPELYRSAATGRVVDIFKSPEAPPPKQHIESIERLSQHEILEMSEKVIVGGARLRDIYESRQITESGLKHILTEFLSGGDVKKALDQELLVKEMTYERDPGVRDSLSAGYASSQAGGGAAGDATPGITPDQLSIAEGRQILKAADQPLRKDPEQSDTPNAALAKAKRTEGAIIASWAVFVVVLVIVIFWLLARR